MTPHEFGKMGKGKGGYVQTFKGRIEDTTPRNAVPTPAYIGANGLVLPILNPPKNT